MKTTPIFATFASFAAASFMLLAAVPTQAAPTRAELDEVDFALALKEAGSSFPAIEEALIARNKAIAATDKL